MSPEHKKTAIIVRHGSRSKDLEASLKNSGYEVVFLPLIDIHPPSDGYASLDAAIKRIDSYDWLVLTSANGVNAFFDRLAYLSASAPLPEAIKIAAVGPMTAEAVRSRDGRVVLVPEEHSAKGLRNAFLGIDVEGLKFLLPRAREGRQELIDSLEVRGAVVDIVEAYEVAASQEEYKLPSSFDDVYFFSPSAVREFVRRFGKSSLEGRTLHPIGESTATEIEKYIPQFMPGHR